VGSSGSPMSGRTTAALLWASPPTLPRLAAGEIQVFAFALDPWVPRLSKLERSLSPEEAVRAARFRHAADRRRYVVGRASVRTILAAYLDQLPHQLRFRQGVYGKPALQGGPGTERVRFNASRSREVGLLAMQLDADLGVDIEHVRPFPDALDVAKRFFAPDEHTTLCALPRAEVDGAFFSYWTRKEAVVKSVGLGLSHPVDAFALGLNPGPGGERVTVVGAAGADARWVAPLPPPAEHYVAALATADAPRVLRCWAWSDRPTHQ